MNRRIQLKWKSYPDDMRALFCKLRKTEELTDVVLSNGEKSVKCHKVILSSACHHFYDLMKDHSGSDLIIFLGGVDTGDMLSLVDFMYTGVVDVPQLRLCEFLALAKQWGVRGLGVDGTNADAQSTPASKRSRPDESSGESSSSDEDENENIALRNIGAPPAPKPVSAVSSSAAPTSKARKCGSSMTVVPVTSPQPTVQPQLAPPASTSNQQTFKINRGAHSKENLPDIFACPHCPRVFIMPHYFLKHKMKMHSDDSRIEHHRVALSKDDLVGKRGTSITVQLPKPAPVPKPTAPAKRLKIAVAKAKAPANRVVASKATAASSSSSSSSGSSDSEEAVVAKKESVSPKRKAGAAVKSAKAAAKAPVSSSTSDSSDSEEAVVVKKEPPSPPRTATVKPTRPPVKPASSSSDSSESSSDEEESAKPSSRSDAKLPPQQQKPPNSVTMSAAPSVSVPPLKLNTLQRGTAPVQVPQPPSVDQRYIKHGSDVSEMALPGRPGEPGGDNMRDLHWEQPVHDIHEHRAGEPPPARQDSPYNQGQERHRWPEPAPHAFHPEPRLGHRQDHVTGPPFSRPTGPFPRPDNRPRRDSSARESSDQDKLSVGEINRRKAMLARRAEQKMRARLDRLPPPGNANKITFDNEGRPERPGASVAPMRAQPPPLQMPPSSLQMPPPSQQMPPPRPQMPLPRPQMTPPPPGQQPDGGPNRPRMVPEAGQGTVGPGYLKDSDGLMDTEQFYVGDGAAQYHDDGNGTGHGHQGGVETAGEPHHEGGAQNAPQDWRHAGNNMPRVIRGRGCARGAGRGIGRGRGGVHTNPHMTVGRGRGNPRGSKLKWVANAKHS